MRKYILLFMLSLFACGVCAQQLKVKSFSEAFDDASAQSLKYGRKDTNGKYCAIIKVGITLDGVTFGGPAVLNEYTIHGIGEYFVYMAANGTMLKVYHPSYTPLVINFGDYGIDRVKSGMTYVLTLEKPSGYVSAEPADAGGNLGAFVLQPKTAVLYVDGVQQTMSPDGEYSVFLGYGSHTYKVEAGGYIGKSGTFTIGRSEAPITRVSLESALATVSVTCPTPAVSLYVDKKSVGTLPWTGSLSAGMHLVEARRSGYRSAQQTIQLAQQQRLDVRFDALVAIQGNLAVNYKPFGADVYVDGSKVGQSPRVFNGLLVGNHQVEIRKEGYATARQTVTIAEAQTTNISGTLTAEAASSSSSNSSASSSSLSGNTITIPIRNGVNIKMVRVEAGTFTMGATPEMKNPDDDEKPTHRVTLTNDYYLGKYEVTQAQWQAVMGSNPSRFKGADLPVECVSWNDCQEFIRKLNSLTGRRFRLPTEAEWEYAARGGKKSRGYQYGGSNDIGAVAWYGDNSGSKTHPVGMKQANELGIYDMAGNVWEWCQDCYASYNNSPQTNPTGPSNGDFRVDRGGSWGCAARYCRASFRFNYDPDFSNDFIGFRLCLSE